MTAIQYINKLLKDLPTYSDVQWKEIRRQHISGTDVSVLLGVNPWRTPLQLYYDKIEGADVVENLSMRRGKALEPLVADIYCERTGAVIVNPDIDDKKKRYFIHPDFPLFGGSFDRLTVRDDRIGLLEIKTAVNYGCEKFREGIPPVYMTQGQSYLWILEALLRTVGYKESVFLDFAVLLDDRYESWEGIGLDDDYIAHIYHAGTQFKAMHLDPQTPPQPVDLSDVKRLFRDVISGSYIEAGPDLYELFVQRKSIREAISFEDAPVKVLKAKLEDVEFKIRNAIGNNEAVYFRDQEIATLKATKDGIRRLLVKEKLLFDTGSF